MQLLDGIGVASIYSHVRMGGVIELDIEGSHFIPLIIKSYLFIENLHNIVERQIAIRNLMILK